MRTRSVKTALVTIAAGAVVLLGACADGQVDPGQPGTPTDPSTTLPEFPTLPPTVPPFSPPVLPPTDARGEATITGEVYAGVEPNCVLVATEYGDFLIYGEPADDVRMGATVTLRGVARPELATTCQQGTPFEVLEVVD